MNNKTIPVFFTIDDSFAPYVSVAIHSLIENCSRDRTYDIYIIYQDVTTENQKKIQSLATEYAHIHFEEMGPQIEQITNRKENYLRCDYFTATIFFRLFLAEMFPQYDKGIYLDSDVVVPGDISKLYDTPLSQEEIIGACTDMSVQDIPELMEYFDHCVGAGGTTYFNSGVLLLNLKLMREKHLRDEFLKLLNTYHFDTVAPDQDYLNAMCHGRVHYLDHSWDVMPGDKTFWGKTPNLIHYNLFDKPWQRENVPYKEYFWKYVNGSGFEEKIKADAAAYTDEQRKADDESMAYLVSRSVEIMQEEKTFQNIYKKGIKVRI